MNKDSELTAVLLMRYLDVSGFLNCINACLCQYADRFISNYRRPIYFVAERPFATRPVVWSVFMASLDDNVAVNNFLSHYPPP